ncbi:alanine--tRNA ligase, partial [Candidatus Saccharibacteria bacterium]|nr:alanine--tRNA ligase [Candidatus Saccharibacteria bacterium]
MTTSQIRQSFLDYFASKGCHIIPSAPLVPKDDPTVLFNIAGMQPIVPYLKGRPHPAGTRLANSQKCVRTSDLEEVGDSSHLTFFEMLGHWSLGDYYKKEALEWIWEWLTAPEYLGLESSKLYATVYQGDKQIPRDDQSIGIWQEIFNDQGLSSEVGKRILTLGREDNWWEIPGAEQSPAGPDSEIFYYLGEQANPVFDPEDPDFIEICNSVFMAYQKTPDGYQDLVKKNVDFGGGLERIAMVKQGKDSVYGIDIFVEIDRAIQAIATKDDLRARRIISDHIRTATMMVGDGVVPDNNGAGYVLRRLVRRALREADRIGIDSQLIDQLVPVVIHLYQDAYQNLAQDKDQIIKVLSKEERLFRATLKKGIRLFHKEVQQKLTGEQAFKLFDTYGFPLELSLEEA